MKENVLIKISGLHPEHSGEEPVELIVGGTFLKNKDRIFLSFDELGEDGSATKCRLKLTPEDVDLTREGGITTRLCFRPGEPFGSVYSTPFGDFDLEIITESIEYRENPDALVDLELAYAVNLNGEFSSNCTLNVLAEKQEHRMI